MRYGLSITCIAALISLGCQGLSEVVTFKGQAGQDVDVARANWPFVPVAMRIHPFTAIQHDAQQKRVVLQVRMELLDGVGDVTKGVGEFRFELYADHGRASRQGEDKRLNVWEAPMRSVEQNVQHYDPITRTYSFRLLLEPPPAPDQKLRLVAQFTDHAGQRLLAEAPLSHRKSADPAPAP